MPLNDLVPDTDMSDGFSGNEGQISPDSGSPGANGLRVVNHFASRPDILLSASRETSLPVKAVNQLTLAPQSDEEGDEDDETDLFRLSPQRPALPLSQLPTGLCYDPRMRFHTELDPPKDKADFHPEDPRRILWIYRTLCEAGLVDDPVLSLKPLVLNPCKMIPVRHAVRSEILKVHFEEQFEFLKGTASKTACLDRQHHILTSNAARPDHELSIVEKGFDSIYFCQSTYNAALLSAGAAIDTALAVARGDEVKNAFAVIRPPGHHAEKDRSMGFCHFDNIAVATRAVQEKHEEIRKVLVVDWYG